jgi:predicted MFS family arabinose efflux permease
MIDQSSPGAKSGRRAAAAFAAMAAIYFFSHLQRTAIPGTIFDELQTDLGLGAAGIAALGSMFTWIYGGMQVFAGLTVDAWGGRRALLLGAAAMAAGSMLFPLATSLPLLFAARALTGFGASFLYLSIIKELNLYFGAQHFPTTLGILLAVGYCGAMAATLPFERAVAAIGWRPALLAVAGLTIAALAAAWWKSLPNRAAAAHRIPFSFRPLGAVLANRSCWPSFASACISFPVYFVVLTTLGKKFLQDFGGVSSPASAASLLAMAATSALTVVAGGLLPKLLGGRRKPCMLAASAILVMGVGLLLAGTLWRAPSWVFLAGYLLLAAAIGLGGPSGSATVKELNRPEFLAAGISVTNALSYIGCGTIAQACGLILDRYRPRAARPDSILAFPPAAYVALFSFLGAIALLNFSFTLAIPETGKGVKA